MINTIAAYLVAMDAISTGLMTGSIRSCTRTAETDTIDTAVAILQLVVLCGETILDEVDPKTTQS